MSSNESLDLSFLELVPRLEPTVFDLDAYFPSKLYIKWSWIETYDLTEKHEQELREKGWQPLSLQEERTFLRLSSHLSPIIAKQVPDQPEQVMLWVRTTDHQFAEEYPVVLAYETTAKATRNELDEMAIGTHALIFEDEQVYRYTLEDLGEVGVLFWQQIYGGTRSSQFQVTNVGMGGRMLPKGQVTESIKNQFQHLREHFLLASNAAHYLAKIYWRHHHHHPGKPVRLPRTLADIPVAFRQSKLKEGSIVPATHGLEAALLAMSNAAEGAAGWKTSKQAPVFVHERAHSSAAVTVRPPQTTIDAEKDISKQLWERITSYSDLDGDVLLAMLAQTALVGQNDQGAVWITAEDILGYRGIVPKHHQTKALQTRDAGHRPEDIQEIAESIERLRNTHVTVRTLRQARKPGARARKVKQESYLIQIADFLVPENAQKDREWAIAWHYRAGDCLNVSLGNQRKVAWLLQKALHYDPYREKWEKRLARYFMFHLRVGSTVFGNSTMTRSIGTLLNELSLPTNKKDPAKTAGRFEKAMRLLQKDGHISDWSEDRYLKMMQHLPARDWLDQWLSYELEISAASLLEELADEMVDRLKQPGAWQEERNP